MNISKKKRLISELQYITKSRSEDLTSLLGSIKSSVNRKEYKNSGEAIPVSELDNLFSNAKEVHLD